MFGKKHEDRQREYVTDEELSAMQGAPVASKIGIRCQKCHCADLRVVYTERHEGYILRRRACRHCGKRITTREGVS